MFGNFCEDSFWDLNQTWYNQVPRFSSCFEDSVLVFAPCTFFSLIMIMCLASLRKYNSRNSYKWSFLNVSKIGLSFCLLCLSIIICCFTVYEYYIGKQESMSVLLAVASQVVFYLLMTVTMSMYRKFGITSTGIGVVWLTMAFCSVILFRTVILDNLILEDKRPYGVIFICSMILHPLVFLELLLSIFNESREFEILHDNKMVGNVTFLTFITFAWYYRLILLSRKKLLDLSDLAFYNFKFTARYAMNLFSKKWKFQGPQGVVKSQSLAWALFSAFWEYLLIALFLTLSKCAFMMLPALILDRMIDFTKHDFYTWRGYMFAVLLLACDVMTKICMNTYFQFQVGLAFQMKSALCQSIFKKVLSMSTASRKKFNSGSIMNFVSVDLPRFDYFSYTCASLVTIPVQISVIVYLMYCYIGPSAFASLGVIALLVPFTFFVSQYSQRITVKQMETKDERLKFMNEILAGIKILKLYAWEIPFSEKVSKVRKTEVKYIFLSQMCFVVTNFIYFCVPFVITITAFATFVLIDSRNVLTPTRAFVTLTLMEQLRYSLFALPDCISDMIRVITSLGRIREFLTADDTDVNMVGNNPKKDHAVTFRNVSTSWLDASECTLKDITLHIPKGKLVAVIGQVGSGKSSLLSAMLNEMNKIEGSIDVDGSIAYVPQQAWILNRTLKANILLVQPPLPGKYENILDICCLRPDLMILPGGDATEIGEKGVNLSGGQKQRVSVARALYQDKDIYLLDDPLSAVDVHVRKALFDDVIGNEGYLKDKTRILVTHDASYLHRVDFIVCMKDGSIDEMGSYSELIEKKGSFAAFVQEHSTVKSDEDATGDTTELIMNHVKDEIDDGVGDAGSIQEDKVTSPTEESKLIDEEDMAIGTVHMGIYKSYIRHVGIICFAIATLGYIASIVFETGCSIWLSVWSGQAGVNGTVFSLGENLAVYGSLGFAQALCVVIGSGVLIYGSKTAAVKFHDEMLSSILRSPMSFFDRTPMGRILNRFSSDMDILDIQIVYRFDGWLTCFFETLASIIVIAMNTPMFLAFIPILIVTCYLCQIFHLKCFCQIKRLESVSRSPLFSHLLETIQGTSSINSMKVGKEFYNVFVDKLDTLNLCSYNAWTCNRWLSFHLDILGSCMIFLTGMLAIHYRHTLSPAIVGLIISYSLMITGVLKWLVRMNTELEDKSIAIERIDEYCNLKPEAPWQLPQDDYHKNWPQNGTIVFDRYSTKYRENLDLVLKELSMSFNKHEKVGIIGRTGAGKSSITLALFRILEPADGVISIDGVNISNLGLHMLRSKLTIIPQDPILFTGSLRHNLDPFETYSDAEIWKCLEQANLKAFVIELSAGLEYDIEEGGANLSAGQRQLVCLARALLKNSRILVLDEATASVDMETDSLIQNTIRTAFADRTVLTIAHRIHTVLDYDKIVVIDNGSVLEVGNPKELLANPNSRFYEMHREAKK